MIKTLLHLFWDKDNSASVFEQKKFPNILQGRFASYRASRDGHVYMGERGQWNADREKQAVSAWISIMSP